MKRAISDAEWAACMRRGHPLAELVLQRVTKAASHSSRLRHALRRASRERITRALHWDGRSAAPAWIRFKAGKKFNFRPAPSAFTIGPIGVLP